MGLKQRLFLCALFLYQTLSLSDIRGAGGRVKALSGGLVLGLTSTTHNTVDSLDGQPEFSESDKQARTASRRPTITSLRHRPRDG